MGNISTNGTISAKSFIGSLSGNATSATKLTTNAGSANTPIYFSNGIPVVCTSVDLNAATATRLKHSSLSGSTTNTTGYWNPFTWKITSPYSNVSGIYAIHDAEKAFSGIFSLKARTGSTAATVGESELVWLAASTTPPTLTLTYVSDTTNVTLTYRLYISVPGTYRTYQIIKITEYVGTGITTTTSSARTTSITGTILKTASSSFLGGIATVSSGQATLGVHNTQNSGNLYMYDTGNTRGIYTSDLESVVQITEGKIKLFSNNSGSTLPSSGKLNEIFFKIT